MAKKKSKAASKATTPPTLALPKTGLRPLVPPLSSTPRSVRLCSGTTKDSKVKEHARFAAAVRAVVETERAFLEPLLALARDFLDPLVQLSSTSDTVMAPATVARVVRPVRLLTSFHNRLTTHEERLCTTTQIGTRAVQAMRHIQLFYTAEADTGRAALASLDWVCSTLQEACRDPRFSVFVSGGTRALWLHDRGTEIAQAIAASKLTEAETAAASLLADYPAEPAALCWQAAVAHARGDTAKCNTCLASALNSDSISSSLRSLLLNDASFVPVADTITTLLKDKGSLTEVQLVDRIQVIRSPLRRLREYAGLLDEIRISFASGAAPNNDEEMPAAQLDRAAGIANEIAAIPSQVQALESHTDLVSLVKRVTQVPPGVDLAKPSRRLVVALTVIIKAAQHSLYAMTDGLLITCPSPGTKSELENYVSFTSWPALSFEPQPGGKMLVRRTDGPDMLLQVIGPAGRSSEAATSAGATELSALMRLLDAKAAFERSMAKVRAIPTEVIIDGDSHDAARITAFTHVPVPGLVDGVQYVLALSSYSLELMGLYELGVPERFVTNLQLDAAASTLSRKPTLRLSPVPLGAGSATDEVRFDPRFVFAWKNRIGMLAANCKKIFVSGRAKEEEGAEAGEEEGLHAADGDGDLVWISYSLDTGVVPPSPAGASLVVQGDNVVLIGGSSDSSPLCDHVYVLDLESLRWRKVPTKAATGATVPPMTMNHTATLVDDRIVAVLGGQTSVGSFRSTVRVLDLSTWTWLNASPVLGAAPAERVRHAVCVAKGGMLLVSGGADSSGILSDVHVLDTHSLVWAHPSLSSSMPNFSAALGLRIADHSLLKLGEGSRRIVIIAFGGQQDAADGNNDRTVATTSSPRRLVSPRAVPASGAVAYILDAPTSFEASLVSAARPPPEILLSGHPLSARGKAKEAAAAEAAANPVAAIAPEVLAIAIKTDVETLLDMPSPRRLPPPPEGWVPPSEEEKEKEKEEGEVSAGASSSSSKGKKKGSAGGGGKKKKAPRKK
jgi:hypothetical protein